jgi:hypothetical protein
MEGSQEGGEAAKVEEDMIAGMEDKAALLAHLAATEFISHRDPQFFHGRVFDPAGLPAAPEVSWDCPLPPRWDEAAPTWLTATEHSDTEAVVGTKVRRLARLLRLSEQTVVYSGAGLSVSAGVGQAARGAAGFSDLTTDAAPTATHRALAALRAAGLLHDGLPQKAGYPQEDIIEIHGSWYDPSNPVVCMSGVTRRDL